MMLVAAAALAALVVAGCGGSSNPSTGGTTAGAGGLTAQQIAEKSAAAMQSVKSASFTADLSASVKGDASKVTDTTLKPLLSAPITLKAQGKVSNEPQKLDMTLNAAAAGQSFAVALKMDNGQIWIQFMNQWYVIPQSMLSGLTGASPAPSASSAPLTEQLGGAFKSLGIDPTTWTESYQLVGTDTLDGTAVYHVAQVLNVSKMVDDLVKASGSVSSLTGGLGGASASPSSITPADAQAIKDALKGLKLDYYYQKDNYYLRKLNLAVTADLSKDAQAAAQGLQSADVNFTVTVADFDQPFTVAAPTGAKPFQDLMNALLGSGGLQL